MATEFNLKEYGLEDLSKEDYPRTCPSCKSPYWDKPRKEKKCKK